MAMTRPLKIFISYSHRDERLKDELYAHLSVLEREGLVKSWHDRRIAPGQDWAIQIDKEIESSDFILLLIRAYFISSSYCCEKEMKRAMDRHVSGKTLVIPIILRPVDWQNTPFARLKALPTDGRPVQNWKTVHDAFEDVTRGVREAIQTLRRPEPRVFGDHVQGPPSAEPLAAADPLIEQRIEQAPMTADSKRNARAYFARPYAKAFAFA